MSPPEGGGAISGAAGDVGPGVTVGGMVGKPYVHPVPEAELTQDGD